MTTASVGTCKTSILKACLFVLTAALLVAACSRESAPGTATTPEYNTIFEKGPAAVRLFLNKKSITVADSAELILVATGPEGTEITLPGERGKFGSFTVADYRALKPELITPGTIQKTAVIRLEPFLSGEYEIPALKTVFAGTDRATALEIETEPITISVRSMFSADRPPDGINDILPPVSAPPNKPYWFLGAAAAALLAGLVAWYFLKKRKPASAPTSLPPHIVARRELEVLLGRGHLARGEVRLFYFLITDILRRYIEGRFAIRASEQTTEEFFAEISGPGVLPMEHKTLLTAILKQSDLAKFAGYIPEKGETKRIIECIEQFIDESAARPEPEKKEGSS